jgi:transcriptional regulator with XRE-family HTH domain
MEKAQVLIGRCIRALREEQVLTLEQLAAKAGITYQYLSGVETGKENFTIAVLESLSEALRFPFPALVNFAFQERISSDSPRLRSDYFRTDVPLPEGLSAKQIEEAANQTQLIIFRISRHLRLEIQKPLHQFIQGNNFSGLISNILCDAIDHHSPFKHNSSQRYPDLMNPSALRGKGIGLEVKTTIQVGKGGESHNGHDGWHLVACYELIKETGDIRFVHLMFAFLHGHQSKTPDWKYVGSRINQETGSRRTETFNTTATGTTKLRDGSIYLDPTRVSFKRWRQQREGKPPPPWSIFASDGN